MCKICRYDCKHNKSGICYLTVCNKKNLIYSTINDEEIKQLNDFKKCYISNYGNVYSYKKKPHCQKRIKKLKPYNHSRGYSLIKEKVVNKYEK